MILRIILFNELEDFLPQGGVRRRPKKVPLSFSALARGALQAPGCAEDRHSPPAGPPEGRRRQWCARRNDANKFLLFDVESRNHFTKMSNLAKFYEKTSDLAIVPIRYCFANRYRFTLYMSRGEAPFRLLRQILRRAAPSFPRNE